MWSSLSDEILISVSYRIAEIFVRQNFHGFYGWPNIRENKFPESVVLVVLSRDCGQHLRKFYLRIFTFGAIRENFVVRKFPAIQYMHTYYVGALVCKNLTSFVHMYSLCR